jgi:MFS family permease
VTDQTQSVPSSLAPFRQPAFRLLSGTGFVANVCLWMNDVSAAWMMTTLTRSPLWVALVQTAAALPVFMLALVSGAMADQVDRRRHLLATHCWLALVGLAFGAAVLADAVSPPLLLALTFAHGVGVAVRLPAFAAAVPHTVSRTDLPAAITLIGLSMNASRIAGPLLAGLLIAVAGAGFVFLLNGVLAVCIAIILFRWKGDELPAPTPVEGGPRALVSAIRVGVAHVIGSRQLSGVMVRIWVFMFHSAALLGLLALLARAMDGADAGTFALLLGGMGTGALVAAPLMPWLRLRTPAPALLLGGVFLQVIAMATMAITHHLWLALPAMMLFGMSWLTTGNTLTVSAQIHMPDWVRARGMAIYQMSTLGASACGAAFWGQLATWTSVPTSLLTASGSGLVLFAIVNRWRSSEAN